MLRDHKLNHQKIHSHVFNDDHSFAERRIKLAVLLTLVMMVAEISGGYVFNSMALLADGWHMSSHALALGLSMLAYIFARRYANDCRFSFGTWKIEILGGYTSAMMLIIVAGLMLFQSLGRLIRPADIYYNQAISIALVGLIINIVCAWLLKDNPTHSHSGASHAHHHQHHDLNLRAAYVHVLADAATSILAIIALFAGKFWGADWLDPVMGIVGAALVAIWAWRLIRDSAKILLDVQMDAHIVQEITTIIDQNLRDAQITDLHVWQVGNGKYACIISLIVHKVLVPDEVRHLLSFHKELVHITVEINNTSQQSL